MDAGIDLNEGAEGWFQIPALATDQLKHRDHGFSLSNFIDY